MKKIMYPLLLALLCSCGSSSGKKKEPIKDASQAPQPILMTQASEQTTVNIYIENSGSMDGYVNGQTQFKDAIYNYVGNIKIAGIADTVNYYYINKKIIPMGDDLVQFINGLNSPQFKPQAGGGAITDISGIFKQVLDASDNNTVSILVSDFIISPGQGKDAASYLAQQKTLIKDYMGTFLPQNKVAVKVCQLTSEFDGWYYNREGSRTRVKAERPYYIWIIGNTYKMAELLNRVPMDKIQGSGVKNSYTLLPGNIEFADNGYSILPNPKWGTFERDKSAPRISIKNIRKESKGPNQGTFMFTIGADFSLLELLLGREYLQDTDNYARLINKQDSKEFFIELKNNTNPATVLTHNIQLSTRDNPRGDLEIVLKNKTPAWVYSCTDSEGININAPNAMNQTYGLKYLIEGLSEAYEILGYTYYAKMNFTLK